MNHAQIQKSPLPGRCIGRIVSYIMRGPIYGLAEGWVIMSVQ